MQQEKTERRSGEAELNHYSRLILYKEIKIRNKYWANQIRVEEYQREKNISKEHFLFEKGLEETVMRQSQSNLEANKVAI